MLPGVTVGVTGSGAHRNGRWRGAAVDAASVRIGEGHRQAPLDDDDARQRPSPEAAQGRQFVIEIGGEAVRTVEAGAGPIEFEAVRVVVDAGVGGRARERVGRLERKAARRLAAQGYLQAVIRGCPREIRSRPARWASRRARERVAWRSARYWW